LIGVLTTSGAFALIGTATGGDHNWYLLWGLLALAALPAQSTIWTSAVASWFELSARDLRSKQGWHNGRLCVLLRLRFGLHPAPVRDEPHVPHRQRAARRLGPPLQNPCESSGVSG
jgi:hypothetical protein